MRLCFFLLQPGQQQPWGEAAEHTVMQCVKAAEEDFEDMARDFMQQEEEYLVKELRAYISFDASQKQQVSRAIEASKEYSLSRDAKEKINYALSDQLKMQDEFEFSSAVIAMTADLRNDKWEAHVAAARHLLEAHTENVSAAVGYLGSHLSAEELGYLKNAVGCRKGYGEDDGDEEENSEGDAPSSLPEHQKMCLHFLLQSAQILACIVYLKHSSWNSMLKSICWLQDVESPGQQVPQKRLVMTA
jgi:hypothetical protein